MSASPSQGNPTPAMTNIAPTSHPLVSQSSAAPGPVLGEVGGGAIANEVTPIGGGTGEAITSGASRPSAEGEIASMTPPEPKCHLRVLIISGQTHVFSFEPEITVGRMKEIVWSSWPSDWTSPSAPPSPSFLRVLYSGRILQDDSTLASNGLPASLLPSNPTVLHISVRSFSLRGDEGDPKLKGFLHPTTSRTSRRNEEAASSGGCKCVIM